MNAEHIPHPNPDVEPHECDKGLPRLVLEIRAHLGPTATPEEVVAELRTHGVEATPDDVRELWPGCDMQAD